MEAVTPPPLTNISEIDKIHRTNLISVGEARYKIGGLCGPRVQDRYELIFLHHGSATIHVDGDPVEVEPNEIILLKPGSRELLEFSKTSASHQSWCIMAESLLPSPLQPKILQPLPKVLGSQQINDLLRMALNFPVPLTHSGTLFMEQLVISIFYEFFRLVDLGSNRTKVYPSAVRKSIEYIETFYGNPIKLADIASHSNISPHHLIKLFRKHVQQTPMRYLWNFRIQHGAELLRTTGLSVSEVAYRVGFQSPFHFSRNIKEEFGLSPKEYRDRAWDIRKE